MSRKLAIRGHSTRGKEVIELLQMMGGENTLIVSGYKLSGYEPFNLYYINDNGVINYKCHSLDKDMVLFTLEEFLEKYPFKVGDNVSYINNNGKITNTSILGMSWNEEKHTMWYQLETGVTRFVENIWRTMKQKKLKDYLKPGYVVEYEDGNKFVITQDVHGNNFGLQLGYATMWDSLEMLDSIVKVYQINYPELYIKLINVTRL